MNDLIVAGAAAGRDVLVPQAPATMVSAAVNKSAARYSSMTDGNAPDRQTVVGRVKPDRASMANVGCTVNRVRHRLNIGA